MRKFNVILLFAMVIPVIILFPACNKVAEQTKSSIGKGGQVLGESGADFFSGISDGIEKKLEVEIQLPDELKNKGLSMGKTLIENDSLGNVNNILAIYFIFNKNLEANLRVKVFDKNGLEYGRSALKIKGNEQDAHFFMFHFDKLSQIKNRSKITIEQY